MKKEHKAYIGLTLGTLITGLSVMFVIIALRSANTSDLLAHRFSVGTLGMLVAYTFGKVKFPRFSFKQILPLLVLSTPYPILFFTLQTEGLKHTTASQAGILLAMMPILTVIVASIFLKEKSNIKQIISILLSVSGIVYILLKTGLDGGNNNLKGNVLILLSMISVVTYYTLARKINKNYNTLDISFFMTLTACVVFNLIAIFGHIKAGTISQFYDPFKESSFLWSIFYLGILSFMFTSFFSNYALAVIPASQVAIFNNLSPIITIFSGVLILNERLYTFHIIGGLMVIFGVIGTLFFKEKRGSN
ncbi:MAG TPA: DMT family transporter [Bacteroidales bacterium]|nr:DMT family transporter [Bacteroidales bacterium]